MTTRFAPRAAAIDADAVCRSDPHCTRGAVRLISRGALQKLGLSAVYDRILQRSRLPARTLCRRRLAASFHFA